MADAIVKSKVDEGKTQKEAAGSIKTSITSHYKPLWIAADRKGREEIQNVLKQLKVNGKALYTGEDWTNWNKAAKRSKRSSRNREDQVSKKYLVFLCNSNLEMVLPEQYYYQGSSTDGVIISKKA